MEKILERPPVEVIKKTSRVRQLIGALPGICGCENPDSLSKRFTAIYDMELQGGTAFDCQHSDITVPGNRLAMINPGRYNPENFDAANIGFSRLVIAEFQGYRRDGEITEEKLQQVMDEFSPDAERKNSQIDAILTYDMALAGFWWQ